MRRFKTEMLLFIITAMFASFCLGHYFGRRQETGTVTVTRSRTSAAQEDEFRTSTTQTEPRETERTAETVPESELSATESQSAADGKVNLNTATVEELMTLPGIGEALANRIVEYREIYGAFGSVDELDAVSGIGTKRIEAIREFVTVEGINENTGGG